MSTPNITIQEVSRNKISEQPGYNICNFSFSSDEDLIQYDILKEDITTEEVETIQSIMNTVEQMKTKTVAELAQQTVRETAYVVLKDEAEYAYVTYEHLIRGGRYNIIIIGTTS